MAGFPAPLNTTMIFAEYQPVIALQFFSSLSFTATVLRDSYKMVKIRLIRVPFSEFHSDLACWAMRS